MFSKGQFNQNGSQAVQNQPLAGGSVSPWAPVPDPDPAVSQGLEYLNQVSQLLIQRKIKFMQAYRSPAPFIITTANRQQIFSTPQEDCCANWFRCYFNSYTVPVLDNAHNEVLQIHRPLDFSYGIFQCCQKKVEVRTATGEIIAYIYQKLHCCAAIFIIQDANEENMLKISSNICHFTCTSRTFKIESIAESSQVGKLTMYLSGSLFSSGSLNFELLVPLELDMKMKAALLCTCIILGRMQFRE
ncbi:phospholipid scramblase 1-like [Rana temporaria]|uniref:phospholipid scramblase 1-like n=1 Tax=Rana temporaria TaxID=8407 RepID=UPI001AAD2613|nr:phospholipid scramblase 1-like [Rana temporaria]